MLNELVRVVWIDDDWGYRCPECYVYLCVPRRDPDPYCPSRCLRDNGEEETDGVPDDL